MHVEHATLDFETYSEAGYHWDVAKQRWTSLPWWPNEKRGLEVVGVDNYVSHPTFHPSMLAYDLHEGAGEKLVTFDHAHEGIAYPCPPELAAWIAAGRKIESWNCGFEWFVWEWCRKNWGWPELPLAQQLCAMAKSAAAAYPRGLDNAASVLGTPRKDPIGDRLIKKLTVPKNPTKTNLALRWTPQTAPQDFAMFGEYNKQDVRSEFAASMKLPPMSPRLFAVWQFDQRVNRRGVYIDLVSVEHCLAIVEQASERACAELQRLTLERVPVHDKDGVHVMTADGPMFTYVSAVNSPSEVAATLRWMGRRGFYFQELDEETVGDALKRSDLPTDVARVFRIRQQLSFGSVKKLYALKAKTGPDSRLRDAYAFHGAHTGLWNGQGAQLANLPRPMHEDFEKPAVVDEALRAIACRSIELLEILYGPGSKYVSADRPNGLDPLEVVASCLRSLIMAAPGHRFISADFNAIQAVVTSALAGEEWRLEVFRTHGKIYEAMAAKLTGVSFDEIVNYKKLHGKHHPHRQNYGKLAVLSSDFGAWINGWKRFGADKVMGSDDAIKQLILKTRAAQPMIGELWGGQTRDKFDRWRERPELYGLEGAVISALKNPGQAYEYRNIVYQQDPATGTLYCRPPSGGTIRYHNAKLHPSERPYASPWEVEITYEGWNSNATKGAPGWQTMNLYGGVLTQNVVSHESWEIQCYVLLNLEAATYPTVMHTHDEGVLEVPIGSHHTAAEATTIWRRLPEWAKTPDGQPWPIKVPDAWEQPRYGKW